MGYVRKSHSPKRPHPKIERRAAAAAGQLTLSSPRAPRKRALLPSSARFFLLETITVEFDPVVKTRHHAAGANEIRMPRLRPTSNSDFRSDWSNRTMPSM
jgi:hypothetical protein